MSNPFAEVTSDKEIKNEKDSLGGGFIWESGAQLVTITMAYAGEAGSGAKSMNFEFKAEDGRVLKHTEYVTAGRDKGGKNYYEKDGVKSYLPGYNIVNAIALLTTRKELSEQTWEEKLVKVYNAEAKGDVPTKVLVATDMLGKQIILGVIKETVNKNVKNEAGKYVPSAETRDQNIIDKVFEVESKKTIAEYRDKKETAEFYQPWVDKNTGVTRNRVKTDGVVAGAPKGATGGGAAKPKESLFD